MTERLTVAELLAEARSRYLQVLPADLEAEQAAGALIVDTRPQEQRARDGELPGAVVIDRNVLEWRLDPASPDRIPQATGYDRRIILVCNQGYSSSLAAATLQRLGLLRATDLAGGFQAWQAWRAGRTAAHWDATYRRAEPDQLSWYQRDPEVSLQLIDDLGVPPAAAVLDIGGGNSALVDRLLARGFTDITVLDVSSAALAAARARVGPSPQVTWLEQDLLAWRPERRYDVWHDRALFHFQTDPADRDHYLGVLHRAVNPGGHVVIGAFAEDGPDHCSGLPVARYTPTELATALGDGLQVVASRREEHTTPAGVIQPFTWLVARLL